MSTEMKALGLENESKLFDGLPPKQSASDNRERGDLIFGVIKYDAAVVTTQFGSMK